jgi:protocatechuate 3,4-dioxygenase beta subunit
VSCTCCTSASASSFRAETDFRYRRTIDDQPRISRRDSLVKLGGLLAGATAVGGWKVAEEAGAGPAAVASGLVTCVLLPESTEGPFYLDEQRLRRNITEGKGGVPLALRLTVVDVSTCRTIRGAAVDVWHCDAAGAYSGVQGARGTFLRGIQRTNAKGVAVFRTIYPGWYPGRTPHIHVKVALGGNVVHTGQLYFPDAVTDAIYRRVPYNRRPSRTTRNAADSIYRNGGRRSTLKLTRSGTGYVGAITMGVQRS